MSGKRKCDDKGCKFDCYIQYAWNQDVLRNAGEVKQDGSAASGICEHCVKGKQQDYVGQGKEIQVADKLDAYINGPDGAKTAVIVNHDLFGWKSPNCRAVVDKLAGAGHVAVLADLYRGMVWKHGFDFSPANLGPFFGANPDDRVQSDIRKLCAFLAEQKGIAQIGIMGFCWGGRQAFNSSTNGLVKAAVSCHGGGVVADTCKDIKCPVFIVQAALDSYPPLATVQTIKQTLEGMKKEVQLKVYPDVNHGFSVRPDDKDANAMKQSAIAIGDAMDFLCAKLKPSGAACAAVEEKAAHQGKEMQIADKLNVYISGAEGSQSAVVVGHDLFGWKMAQARTICDQIAAAGHVVVLPDLFRGGEWTFGTDFSKANLQTFFGQNPDARVQEDIKKTCQYLTKKQKITQIGMIGFCWGGRQAFNASVNGQLKAVVSAHGGGVVVDTCKDIKCPVFLVQAELDANPALATVQDIKQTLESLNKEVALKVYSKVNHGFAIRADPSDANAVKQQQAAIRDSIEYFKRLQGSPIGKL